jgi:hypothetical protein
MYLFRIGTFFAGCCFIAQARRCLLCGLLLSFVNVADAGVVVGVPAPSFNCFPFNCYPTVAGIRYQQVYASTAFPSILNIADIEFYDRNFGSAVVSSGTYEIHLSTTSKAVNGLDTSNLDANVGSDDIVVADWVLNVPLPVTGGFVIPLSTTFTYDPSRGNLLLDIFTHSLSGGTGFLDAWNATTTAPFSRAIQCTGCTGTAGYGLATGFNSAVPEPGTVSLLALVLGAIGCKLVRPRS